MFNVALAWQALELPSGARGLGIVLLVRSVCRIGVLIFGGALADRYQKRMLMFIGDATQLIMIGWLAYLAAADTLQLWQLTLVAGTAGLGSGIFLSSSASMVPELVDESHLPSANSLRSFSLLLGEDLIGPALGGFLVATVGTALAFAIDAGTFVVSAAALAFIRPRVRRRTERTNNLFADVHEGLRYVFSAPWLWVPLVAVGTLGNFVSFGPLPVLVPLLVRERLHAGAAVLGFVMSGYGFGGVAGALFAGSRNLRLHSASPAMIAWGVGGLCLGCLAVAPNAGLAAFALAIVGFSGQAAEVIWVTLQQKFVPPRLLGRVISTDWLVSLSLQPVGVAIAAPVAAAIGVPGAFIAGSAIQTTSILLGLTHRGVRRIEKPADDAFGT
jgi:predicted MFS family arabinose efflux permease